MGLLDRYIELENDVDNRDKVIKILQNIYLLSSYLEDRNLERGELYFKIYQQVYTCRRLFKLGKFLQSLQHLIQYRKQYSPRRNLLQIPQASNEMSTYIVYISYIFFNLVENIMVINQMGFWDKSNFQGFSLIFTTRSSKEFQLFFDHKVLKIVTHAFWSLGLLTQLVYYLNRLRANFRREAELKTQIQNGMTPNEFIKQIQLLSQERYQYGLVILRFIGDLACALQKTHIPEKLLNTRFNKGLVACGGIMSALLQIYQSMKRGQNV